MTDVSTTCAVVIFRVKVSCATSVDGIIYSGIIYSGYCLVTRDNNKLQTTVYRKPTHTDRLLDQTSYNPTSHKATTIRTLTRRAQLVCDSPDSLQDDTDYLYNVFSKNNYNTDFVRQNTHSNTDTQTNVNSGPVATATVPYIRGTSETIAVYYNLTIYVLHTNP